MSLIYISMDHVKKKMVIISFAANEPQGDERKPFQ